MPGFFKSAMKEDERRIKRTRKKVGASGRRIATLSPTVVGVPFYPSAAAAGVFGGGRGGRGGGKRAAVGHPWHDSAFNRQQSSEAVRHMMMQVKGEECSRVQIHLCANGLRDMDVFSKSDPMAVLELGTFNQDDGAPVWSEIGRTEVVKNNLNPKWMKHFVANYYFSLVQLLRITVYDVDDSSSTGDGVSNKLTLEDQDFLGQTECWLSELVRGDGQALTKQLQPHPSRRRRSGSSGKLGSSLLRRRHSWSSRGGGGRQRGTLTIHAEEVPSSINGTVSLEFRAMGLDKMDHFPFGKSDPYLKIWKLLEDGSSAPVARTEVVSRDLNPVWSPTVVSLQALCGGDLERPLRLECWDHDTFSRDDFIGFADRSVKQLLQDVELGGKIPLRRPARKKDKPDKVGGTLLCTSCEIKQRTTFLQCLAMGCEISFHVAVDFTASNGHPNRPHSLHYVDPEGKPNAYQQAIRAVGRVIEFYDSDKRFPAWGFGANVGGGMGMLSHCFNLSGDPVHSEVEGVEGILDAYSKARTFVTLAGPTLFTPVIERSSAMAEAHLREGRLKYSVLLIITDGIVNDMESTMDAIVSASRLPLSILIVGVGSADFSRMVELDSDDGPLQSNGLSAQRDIVQFVSMRNISSSHHLASELLDELPTQVVQFMELVPEVPKSWN